MVESLFQDVIKVSLTTSAVIVVLLLLFPLIHKKYTAKWRYWLWFILAVRLLIPFSPSLPQTPLEITLPNQNIELKVPVQNTSPSHFVKQSTELQAPKVSVITTQTITLNEILALVWVWGIAIFMLYRFAGYFLFIKGVLRFARPVEDKQIAELWCQVREDMKISQNIRLMTCKKVYSPMMTGFFRPLLLLPDLNYSGEDLKIILKHELIHFRRKDIWYKFLLVCANAVHWFNPIVSFMRVLSNRDIEMACDFEVVKDSDVAFRKQYSETILAAIHKENQRQTVFSTYFYGGKETMKERFVNIFDMSKKRQGFAALCIIILAISITGLSVAYGSNDSDESEEIDNIALLGSGNTYYLGNGKFIISYGAKKSVVVPLTPDTDDQEAYFADKAVYIAEEVTAIAYGGIPGHAGLKPASPVYVLISNDQGKSWSTYQVPVSGTAFSGSKFLGFTTKNEGWLLLTEDIALGHQENRIFQTSDGGKTWQEIGNTKGIYDRVVTGAGFANVNVGFVSFRHDSEGNPVVYRTEDQGKVWTKCTLEIPESFRSIADYATSLSPVFYGAKGILPVTFLNNEGDGEPIDVRVQYVTADYGKTWTFNEKYNLALIWADAWTTRDGRTRYEIMDSRMQEEFRAQQLSPDNFVIRWSSPWVVSYDINMDGEQAVITYWYTDSTTSTYKGVERLTFGEEDGQIVVIDCKTEIEMEEYVNTVDWKAVDTGLYAFSIPNEWKTTAFSDGSVSFTFMPNSEILGTLTVVAYDSSLPLSQFIGNHGEMLSRETLEGCKYPATKTIIRRTQPAAANDDSYRDEVHIYLIPENSKYAFDLFVDSSWSMKRGDEIAKSMVINTNLIQQQILANEWANAVKNRDGKGQYDLLSSKTKKKVYDYYQNCHWETGTSSPWVDGFAVKLEDKTAVITYTYMTSSGFAGKYRQTLFFAEENGHLVISGYTEPQQVNEQREGTVIAYLEARNTWLSAAFLHEGMFSDMTLSIDGKTKRFPWKTYGGMAFLPELNYADVDGDGQNELIVILCKGEGTGVLVEEIHIINPEDFSEVTVQSPLEALEKRVVTKIEENGVKITLDKQNSLVFPEEAVIAQVGEKESWFNNLAMESIVDYSVQGNNVVVEVGAQLSPASFLGCFNITYEYANDQLKVSGISFSTDL